MLSTFPENPNARVGFVMSWIALMVGPLLMLLSILQICSTYFSGGGGGGGESATTPNQKQQKKKKSDSSDEEKKKEKKNKQVKDTVAQTKRE